MSPGLRKLMGAGHRIMLFTLPFVLAGVASDLLWPPAFRMGWGTPGLILGLVLLAVGVPLWLGSAIQVLRQVPRGKLITTGGFAWVLHPLYLAVSLLVIPGCGLVLDSWLGFAIGAAMYVGVRLFAVREERELAAAFPREYPAYRAKVLLPWL